MAVYKRGDSWCVRLQIGGKQYKKSLGKGSTREDAEALELKIRGLEVARRLGKRRHGWIAPPKRAKVHHLYRHYDHDGRLLYVGISLSGLFRLLQHHSTATWGEDIATVTIERHPTRVEVLAAEAVAIITENPLHNVLRPVLQAERITYPQVAPPAIPPLCVPDRPPAPATLPPRTPTAAPHVRPRTGD